MQQPKPTRQRCPYCAEEQDAGHRFCHRCGAWLPQQLPAEPDLFERITPLVPAALVSLALVFVLLTLTGSDLTDAGSAREVDVLRIDVDAAYEYFQNGDAVFVDVRTAEAYETDTIPGAVSMPLHELAVRHEELPREEQIVVYDEDTSADADVRAAHLLLDLGYGEVVVLEGGFAAWKGAGYPMIDPLATSHFLGRPRWSRTA